MVQLMMDSESDYKNEVNRGHRPEPRMRPDRNVRVDDFGADIAAPTRKAEIETRKEMFGKLNACISAHGGWVTSIPGNADVVFETLPDSALPWQLIERGWIATAADPPEGQRIISGTIVEKFVRRADGELEPLTAESTKAVAEIRRHAGICRTLRYSFAL